MKAENRLSATTTLTVNVVDSDDQDPTFEHDVYNAKVGINVSQRGLDLIKLTCSCQSECFSST